MAHPDWEPDRRRRAAIRRHLQADAPYPGLRLRHPGPSGATGAGRGTRGPRPPPQRVAGPWRQRKAARKCADACWCAPRAASTSA